MFANNEISVLKVQVHEMNVRIQTLENRLLMYTDDPGQPQYYITGSGGQYGWGNPPGMQVASTGYPPSVPIVDVVRQICKHLGLKIHKRQATEYVELTKE